MPYTCSQCIVESEHPTQFVRVTVTNMNGELLDYTIVCINCLNKFQQLDLKTGFNPNGYKL